MVTTNDGGDGKAGREVFCVRIWMKEQGMYIICFLFLFCFCAVVNCSFMSDA